MTKFVSAVIGDESGDGSLPVLEGTLGPQAVDIQSLYARIPIMIISIVLYLSSSRIREPNTE